MDEEIRRQVLDGLVPLFERARRERLWFWGRYHDIWFSPDELAEQHSRDKFVWGAVNWELREPIECLRELKAKSDEAALAAERFAVRLLSHW